MRIALAVAVLASHTVVSSNGLVAEASLWASPLGGCLRAIVPMFFVLSGFLVAGSLERSRTLMMFMGLRAIRIYPALVTEVLISAFLIGPVVTEVTLHQYFTDPQFFRYLINTTGHISYELPGVFLGNPLPQVVNLQLWTVPYELYCYVVLGIVAVLGLRRRRFIAVLALIGLACLHLAARSYAHGWTYRPVTMNVSPPLLIVYFIAGVAVYLYRERVVFGAGRFLLASMASLALLSGIPFGEYVAIPFLSYATVYLGLCNPPRAGWVKFADYSYGIYLYGFVVQQLVMHASPALQSWWANFLVCLPLSTALAALSWHLVEKPALRRLRPVLARIEDRWMRTHAALAAWIRIRRATSPAMRPPPARV